MGGLLGVHTMASKLRPHLGQVVNSLGLILLHRHFHSFSEIVCSLEMVSDIDFSFYKVNSCSSILFKWDMIWDIAQKRTAPINPPIINASPGINCAEPNKEMVPLSTELLL